MLRVPISFPKKLIFSVVIWIGLLFLVEGVLRVFLWTTSRQRIIATHPVAGYALKPSMVRVPKRCASQRFGKGPAAVFYYSSNAQGFRITAPAGLIREGPEIVLLGDSFALGWCANDEDSLGYLLSEKTGRPVSNLSVVGYSPDVSLALLRDYLQRHKNVGTVVLLIYANDFEEILTEKNYYRSKPYFVTTAEGFEEKPPAGLRFDWLLDQSDLGWLVGSILLPYKVNSSVMPADALRLMCYILEQIRVLCIEHAINLRMFLVDNLAGPLLPAPQKLAFDRLRQEKGLDVSDITSEIIGTSNFADLLTVDGYHWNRHGSERAADVLIYHLGSAP